jgi:protoheme IX farnesyltransferase
MPEHSQQPPAVSWQKDFATLTKIRLNTFVLVTTFFGYLLASRSYGWSWMTLFHTLLGTAAAALGSAAFNQLMEIEQDARMKRTSDRPLPSRRLDTMAAFLIGCGLSAFGLVHLSIMVGSTPCMLTALTLVSYVFVYTPMKRWHSLNTLVGAIPGAIPPLIGWTATGAPLTSAAWFLFALMMFWQLPHFVAINWLCREEYESAGYKMWSNGDLSGRRSARIAATFSVCLTLVTVWPAITSQLQPVGSILTIASGIWMTIKAWLFIRQPNRETARALFLFTLMYLLIVFTLLAVFWRS